MSASCVCSDGYVMSTVTNKCADSPIIRVPKFRLPVTVKNDAVASNLTSMMSSDEQMLRMLMRRDRCGNVFDGVRLVNAYQESDTMVAYDVLLLHKRDTSPDEASARFVKFVETTKYKLTNDDSSASNKYQRRPYKKNTRKPFLKRWGSVVLVVALVLAVLIVIPLSFIVVRRNQVVPPPTTKGVVQGESVSPSPGKHEMEIGVENVGVDIPDMEKPPEKLRV